MRIDPVTTGTALQGLHDADMSILPSSLAAALEEFQQRKHDAYSKLMDTDDPIGALLLSEVVAKAHEAGMTLTEDRWREVYETNIRPHTLGRSLMVVDAPHD